MVAFNHSLTLLVLIGSFSNGFAKDALCDASLTIPTGKCCHRNYARYCCSGIPVCADGGNVTVEKVVFKSDPCSTPWNLSACLGGYYSTNGLDVLPCPEGYFCEENSLCLKPCPNGAYCIQNVLTTNVSACGTFEKCCLPAVTAPIFNEYTKTLSCPGQFYPARCVEGNYCPNTTVMLTCPAGYFCREGSQNPVKCPTLSTCDEGEDSPNTLVTGLIINGCLLVAFFIVLFYFNNRRRFHFLFDLYFRRIRGTRKPSQKYNIKDGIRLALKRLNTSRRNDQDEELSIKKDSYNISFEKLSLTLTSGENKGKILLQGVTGEISAGEVTAVLGPSGSGKTTFLNVLCGKAYYGDAGGTIKVNGKKVCGIHYCKSFTGFVPQDDIMHRSLTVYEVLYYNAVLRLPPPSDPRQYDRIVKQTLKFLGICHVANTQIGDEEIRGISGGQRRRVNIGMELVADPTILFLDEPTTGLDSSSSLAVVKSLNTIALSTNMTICCVIHQPRFEILKMFDKVLFLGQGGRTVFSGSVDEAETYFAKLGYPLPPYVNPADFYMDVITGSIQNENNAYIDLLDEWENYQVRVDEVGSVKQEPRKEMENKEIVSLTSEGSTTASGTPIMNRPNNQIVINVQEAATISTPTEDSDPSRDQSPGELSPSASSPVCSEYEDMLKKPKVVRLGFFAQLWVFMKREFVLQLRMSRTLLLDQALTMIAGAVLGLLFREVYIYDVHETTVLGNIISGLGAVVAATRRFGQNRVVFWRESAAGINRVSYFLAVNLAYIPVLLISPAVYLSIYFSIAAFLAPFSLHYAVFLCAWFYLSGLGYVMSLIMTPRNSQMAAIVTVVIMALLSGGSPELCKLDDTFIATAFYNLSFSRWVAEAIFEIEAKQNSEVLSDIISRVQIDNHYDLESYNICIVALVSMGIGFRVIALLLLLLTKRGQQR